MVNWETTLNGLDLGHRSYSITEEYPDWELTAILEELRKSSSWDDILDKFGRFLAGELLGEPTARSRFLNEAKAMASLVHPNVIPIFQVDEVKGIPFFAMPMLRGMTLQSWIACAEGREFHWNLAHAIGIAKGLAAAHRMGIVHRDLKPENVWIVAEHEGAMIMDFGLSLQLGDDQRLTQSGILLGTPMYMAPEQSKSNDIDARADIYSYGATLYHLFTGQLPFSEQTLPALLQAIANTPPRPLTEIKTDIPESIDTLVRSMMSKNPASRPDILEALKTLQSIQSTERTLRYSP